jgi:Sec-independent protein translocase protein TatA
MTDTLLIVFFAILILGPRQLPQLARQLGRILAELRHTKADFVAQFRAKAGGPSQRPVSLGPTNISEPPAQSTGVPDNA